VFAKNVMDDEANFTMRSPIRMISRKPALDGERFVPVIGDWFFHFVRPVTFSERAALVLK
jgi:hypothetical protein